MRQLLIIFIFTTLTSFGQDDRFNSLFKIAKEKVGIVVSCQPLTTIPIKLDTFRVKYVNRLRTDIKLTDSLIFQIVEATKKLDTAKWEEKEFKNTVVVCDRDENLNASKLLDEWGVQDKSERNKFRKQIKQWTNTDPSERPINYISRPVLTTDNNYGIIAVDLVTHGFCCGGQVILFKYESGQWTDLGSIYKWSH